MLVVKQKLLVDTSLSQLDLSLLLSFSVLGSVLYSTALCMGEVSSLGELSRLGKTVL